MLRIYLSQIKVASSVESFLERCLLKVMYLLSFCLVAKISLLSSSLTSTGGESTSLPPFPSLSSPSSDGGLHSGHMCTNSSTFKGTKDYWFETTKQGSFPRACHCSVCVCLTSGAVDWRPVWKVSSFPPLPDETQSDVDHCMHEGESYQNECVCACLLT